MLYLLVSESTRFQLLQLQIQTVDAKRKRIPFTGNALDQYLYIELTYFISRT